MSALQLKQPSGFYLIAVGEMCERFSYYGAQTLLILYLTKVFALSDNASYSLFGAYAAFAYALPVAGGLLADHLLSLKDTIVIGGILLILGNLLMAIPHLQYFYMGLALNACGIGLYKPNSATLVGKLYQHHGSQEESGFTLFYMGMNIGATASPFVYGVIGTWGYHYSYLVSAAILFVNWLGFIIYRRRILFNSVSSSPGRYWLAYLLIILMCSVVTVLFLHPLVMSRFLPAFAAFVLLGIVIVLFQYKAIERNHLAALLILCFFGTCFFTGSLQVGSSLNLFIERAVNHTLWGWQIPTIMFTSLYPLAVIVSAPAVVAIWSYLADRQREPTVPIKFSLALLLLSIGFGCFMLAALSTHHYFTLTWILLGNLALGAGELCLAPTLLYAISRLAPTHLKSTMMGIWCLFMAMGGYLSSLIAKLSSHPDYSSHKVISAAVYSQEFIYIALATFAIACVIFILTPWINSLMAHSTPEVKSENKIFIA
jgi:POT family proton-dependent oligopeptide transporter